MLAELNLRPLGESLGLVDGLDGLEEQLGIAEQFKALGLQLLPGVYNEPSAAFAGTYYLLLIAI